MSLDLLREMANLKPLKSKIPKYRLASFDIETSGECNNFVMGSILYYDYGFNRYENKTLVKKVFWNKQEMVNFIVNNKTFYNNYRIFATNLNFDILALFENTKEYDNLHFIFRNGNMLMAKYYNNSNDTRNNIVFYDTMSHLRSSVSSLGKILGMRKYEKPSFLGFKPKDAAERKILEDYNLQDSLITLKFSEFLQDEYNNIGCSLKVTLPSTSLDLFRRKYLDRELLRPDLNDILFLNKAYYGGRTEVIKRGKIENCFLYDINSLYPTAMMLYDYPDPNYVYRQKFDKDNNDLFNIFNSEGVSYVKVKSPENLHIPYLPYRHDNKLVFPLGCWNGHYTHYELREALKLGYKVLVVYESIIYTKLFNPFKDFVRDMYRNRLENKGNKLEIVYKILMNSLYGKFAQSIEAQPEVYNINSLSADQFMKYTTGDYKTSIIGSHLLVKKNGFGRIPNYINPIFSIYTTAYARTILYKSLPKDVYYMDTDSCITKERLNTGLGLGEWKLEKEIKEGVIVKPKFYRVNENVKVKGCSRIDETGFNDLLRGLSFEYVKFTKFRESLRRDFSFNQKIKVKKNLDLEDTKRVWDEKFNFNVLQSSKPLFINNIY